jgi:hypothetical protein
MWKWKVYRHILSKAVQGQVKINEVMKELAKEPGLKQNMKAVAAFVPKALKTLNRLSGDRKIRVEQVGIADERGIIEEAAAFLKERFSAEVTVYNEEDRKRYDPKQRATMAMPHQPAIYIEEQPFESDAFPEC